MTIPTYKVELYITVTGDKDFINVWKYLEENYKCDTLEGYMEAHLNATLISDSYIEVEKLREAIEKITNKLLDITIVEYQKVYLYINSKPSKRGK